MKLYQWMSVAVTSLLSFDVALAADLKLGYVKTERIYREAAPAIAIQKKLEKEFDPRRSELAHTEVRIKELKALLSKSKLSNTTREAQQELDELERTYRVKHRELSEEFNQRRNEEFAAVQERATRVLKQIAEKEQYDLILQDAVYVNPKYDLTSKVLKELEK